MKNTLSFLLYSFILLYNSATIAQKTYVPDDNFEYFLITKGHDDVLDDSVLTSTLSSLEKLHFPFGDNIYDLTGIEECTSLKSLIFSENRVSSVDLTNNVNLTYLEFYSNQITTIDLSKNTKLEDLECYGNPLISLDLSKNIELKYLGCFATPLSHIDVSANSKLTGINCSYNKNLTSINLRNGNTMQITNISIENSPNLNCITVDNVTDFEQKWQYVENFIGKTFSTNCDNILDLEPILESNINIYPNPSSNTLYIDGSFQGQIIYLYTSTGYLINKLPLNSINNKIDISNLNEGLYFLSIDSKQYQFIKN